MLERLFKFVAEPTAVQSILKGAVKFTPIHELNDPSELSPTLVAEDVLSSLARLRRDGYSEQDLVHLQRQGHILRRLAPEFQAARVPRTADEATELIRSPAYDAVSTLESLLAETAREISSRVGVFCLSCRYDSLPMWAHYAANASGFVVEFRHLGQVFGGDETGVLNQPIVVRYHKERSGVTFEPRSHESLFFDKFQDWSYEQEVRVVLPLADCRRAHVGGRELYLYDIPPETVSRLIIGWNTPPEKAELVRDVAARLPATANILRACFRRGRVELRDF